jgi:hypothetical protein
MYKHVIDLSRRGFYHIPLIALICNLRHCPPYLRIFTISPRQRQWHSLLVGLSKNQLDRLQSVQNAVVRLINRSSRTEHTKTKLKALHWLPVHSRIDIKIETLAYHCVHGLALSYMAELVSFHYQKRFGLRSETNMLKLAVPPARKE